MILDYNIDEKDYLTYQLFGASKFALIKKKRRKNKIIVPVIYTVLGFLLLFFGIVSLAILFFAIGLLWFLLYPLWESKHYIKHFRAFIKENYKERIGRTATLELSNEFVQVKDNGSELKILTSELEKIFETPAAIFIKINGGPSFILPKNKLPNIDDVKIILKELATYLKIEYEVDEEWEWK